MENHNIYGYGAAPLPLHGETLTPLPSQQRKGLLGIAILSSISVASSVWLFLYISWRMVGFKWFLRRNSATTRVDSNTVDLSLGLSEEHYRMYLQSTQANRTNRPQPPRRLSSATVLTTKTATVAREAVTAAEEDKHSNPIIVLIYHLLLADIQQSVALVISAYWLRYDGIYVPSVQCFAQGWLLGLAKLVAAGFLSIISINTYLTLVWGFRASRRIIYIAIASNWIFSLGCTIGGIVGTKSGMAQGGYYVRAGAWCWINPKFGNLRLWLEYFWIFVAMGLTIILHVRVLWSLYKNQHSARNMPPPRRCCSHKTSPSITSTLNFGSRYAEGEAEASPRPSGHHPAFLLYPLIYIVCTSPLAIARSVDMSQGTGTVSQEYYLVAGALFACHGWLNVLLWSTTVVFIVGDSAEDAGLGKFAFMRTPHERRFGNMIWVQGGSNTRDTTAPTRNTELGAAGSKDASWVHRVTRRLRLTRPDPSPVHRGRSRSIRNLAFSNPSAHTGLRSGSQESLQHSIRGTSTSRLPVETEGGIQMEVVTTIVVEREDDDNRSCVGDSCGTNIRLSYPPHDSARSIHRFSHKESMEGFGEWRS